MPAAIVARELEVRLIDTVASPATMIATRARSTYSKASPATGPAGSSSMNLVDTDLTDECAVRDMLPKAHFATVYAKPAGRPLVDTYITEVSQGYLDPLPWDIEPQFIQPIARPRLIRAEFPGRYRSIAVRPIQAAANTRRGLPHFGDRLQRFCVAPDIDIVDLC